MKKKALIAACVYHTEENDRVKYIQKWFEDLVFNLCHINLLSVDIRLFVYDNSPVSIVDKLKDFIPEERYLSVVFLGGDGVNLGTAGGINECWKHAEEGEYLVKIDDDVIIHDVDWVQQMVEAMERTPKLGLLALKRKDLTECPTHESPDFRTELMMVPQEKGERWYVIEKVRNVFGTVQMYSPELFKKIGYMEQIGPYGFDDYIMSVKCYAAGMFGAFLPHIEIDHIDEGGTEYTTWKQKQAAEVQALIVERAKEYKLGLRDLYYDGNFKEQGT